VTLTVCMIPVAGRFAVQVSGDGWTAASHITSPDGAVAWARVQIASRSSKDQI